MAEVIKKSKELYHALRELDNIIRSRSVTARIKFKPDKDAVIEIYAGSVKLELEAGKKMTISSLYDAITNLAIKKKEELMFQIVELLAKSEEIFTNLTAVSTSTAPQSATPQTPAPTPETPTPPTEEKKKRKKKAETQAPESAPQEQSQAK